MKNIDLSEGEELSREMCFKHLCITFKYYLTDDPEKIQKFRLLTEYIVNEGIIRAVRYSKSKVVFFYDKNQMTKTESYDLLSNIFSKFFADNMPMNNFVSLGCKMFDCYAKKKKDTIYRALKRHRNHKIPTPYTNYF